MREARCCACESLLARTEASSEWEIKCGHCHCVNKYLLGTLLASHRYMSELDWERAEKKRIKRKERQLNI